MRRAFGVFICWLVLAWLSFGGGFLRAGAAEPAGSQGTAEQGAAGALVPFNPDQLMRLLPAWVYFRGQVASVQVRNSGGVTFPGGGVFLVAMVDTSGYASDVQEVYQFYLITEAPISLGGTSLGAGAYGAGVVNGKLTVMDIGGHAVATADTTLDEGMARPRPLQVIPDGKDAVRLYVGRRWIRVAGLAAGK